MGAEADVRTASPELKRPFRRDNLRKTFLCVSDRTALSEKVLKIDKLSSRAVLGAGAALLYVGAGGAKDFGQNFRS